MKTYFGKYSSIFVDLGFLLLDNPKEAFDYAKGVSTRSYRYPITDFIRCMLVNGREHGVRNWHLKLMSAIVLVMSNFGLHVLK